MNPEETNDKNKDRKTPDSPPVTPRSFKPKEKSTRMERYKKDRGRSNNPQKKRS